MRIETVNRLKAAADDMGEEAEVYEDYSGRMMYGEKTTGLVIRSINLFACLAAHAMYELTRECEHDGDGDGRGGDRGPTEGP